MDIDVRIDNESLSVNIDDPYNFDVAAVTSDILDFGRKHEFDLSPLNLDGLIPRMIRGVAGCEGGCPADAKNLVREGYGGFNLSYVEGGILTANKSLDNGHAIEVKIFPDFD